MEVAGLAIGVVPLAIELFKQSISAYKIFIEAKELEKTATHLGTRLAIEERRLAQWGQGTGLSSEAKSESGLEPDDSNLDRRLLENEALCQVVVRTLTCVRDVFDDTDCLSDKYGVKLSSSEKADSEANSSSKSTRSYISKIGRFKWAIMDKEKFNDLLQQLKYYNDSLYSLLPREIGFTITRDVLAVLVASASKDSLEVYRSLGTSRESLVSSGSMDQYKRISSAASVALQISGQSPKVDEVLVIPRNEIQPDGQGSRLGTWEQRRVFLETHQTIRSDAQGSKHRNTRLLASLLSQARMSQDFSTPRCLGISFMDTETPTMIHELPDDVDPVAEPVTLHEMMSNGNSRIPTLDDRFQLAQAICRAIFQMHSAGWMHKDISSKNILFFKDKDAGGAYRVDRPYLKGFRFSRKTNFVGNNEKETGKAAGMGSDWETDDSADGKAVAPPKRDRSPWGSDSRSKGGESRRSQPLRRTTKSNQGFFTAVQGAFTPSLWNGLSGGSGKRSYYSDRRSNANDSRRSGPLRRKARPSTHSQESYVVLRGEHENTDLLREAIYQHPAYVFHKLISEAPPDDNYELGEYARHNKRDSYYKQRHEYYSLGLLLLEIGLWRPVESMGLLSQPVASMGMREVAWLAYNFGFWEDRDLNGRLMTATKSIRAARGRLFDTMVPDVPITWSEELESYVSQLRRVLDEEQIEGMSLSAWNAASAQEKESFWSLWDEVYPHVLLRNDAIELTKRSVGLAMGRRYRDVIVRCLTSDFSVPESSSELKWLRSFNWLIVKELEKCQA
ncbi:uncharacterized protein FPRO_13802 [Fusarium proliferatum ET1]|uniref:Prion-inhibition and propagation HeLo domain-containing protein n=1 Tax=Fusarium proliferatum (strain ET1) TaxID=1227346 RepID=A0A1L7VUC3_FUSPR|nr:uncharacterized protein FPRO_13802 [Fusarium proliferatum ET1]CZR43994.1 uncharacterized protein FPRO_13802 [Fusarium proliferatum ET1]